MNPSDARLNSHTRVLAIGPGGVRGIIPAGIVRVLEQRSGKPAATLFDLIVGGGGGCILATALALGVPAERVERFYREEAKDIFLGSPLKHFLKRHTPLNAVLYDRYDPKALRSGLERLIGSAFLQSCIVPTQLISVVGDLVDIASWTADSNARALDAALLSCRGFGVIDGVSAATGTGIISARRLWPDRKIKIFSLGTGIEGAIEKDAFRKGFGRGGKCSVGRAILPVLVNASVENDQVLCSLPGVEAWELNPFLRHGRCERDDGSASNIRRLVDITKNYLAVSAQEEALLKFLMQMES